MQPAQYRSMTVEQLEAAGALVIVFPPDDFSNFSSPQAAGEARRYVKDEASEYGSGLLDQALEVDQEEHGA